MSKRLIICADGTWNGPESGDKKGPSPSNVVKLASLISPQDATGRAQKVYYHAGLGTEGGILQRLSGGAFGTGISRNIQDLYLFLVEHYRPGDELCFFGFSRGAYTVRSLAGLVRNCGILKSEEAAKFPEAYALYRDRRDKFHPNAARAVDFREQYSWPSFGIKCIGVWDTVGALGIPLPLQIGRKLWEFHDVELSSHVEHAYQALAIDEQRRPFVPCIWIKQASSPQAQVLEQSWFPGVHSNIGGGYSDSGLSDCALAWMCQKAALAGITIEEGLKTAPDPRAALCNSMTFWYRLLGKRIRALGTQLPLSHEHISHAALQRKALLPHYSPRNLMEFMQQHQGSLPSIQYSET